jgi:phospholipase C
MRSRCEFLRLAATAAGAVMMPASIRKALAIPAHRATGTIKDVEHVVILMQEIQYDNITGDIHLTFTNIGKSPLHAQCHQCLRGF